MAISAGTAYITVLPEMTGFVGAISRGLRGVSYRLGALGRSMTRNLTLPIVAAGAESIKLAADFQASMQKIAALVDVPQKEVNKFSKQVLKLSTTLPIPAKELADALYFVTSAGLRGKKAMEALRLSAQAAASGLGPTKVVADAVTSALNAYHTSGLSARNVTDTLIAAVREGKMPIDALAGAIGSVLPVSAELGVKFSEVAGLAAAVSRSGGQVNRTMTGLRYLLTQLIKPSETSAKVIASTGLSVDQLRVMIAKKGLVPALRFLHDNLPIRDFLQVAGGARGIATALAAVGKNAKQVKEVLAKVAHASGSTTHALAVSAKTFTFQWGVFKDTLQAVGIRVGTVLIPALLPLLHVIDHIATKLAALPKHTIKFIVKIAALVAVIGPAISLIAGFARNAASLIDIFFGLAGVFLLVAAAIGGIIYEITRSKSGMKELGKLFSPIVADIKAVAIPAFHQLVALFKQIGPTIVRSVISLFKALQPVFRGIAKAVVALIPAFTTIVKFIVSMIPVVVNVIKSLTPVFTAIVNVISQDVIPVVVGLVRVLAPVVSVILKVAASIIHSVAPAFAKMIKAAGPVVKTIGQLITKIVKELAPGIEALAKALGPVVGWFIKVNLVITTKILPIVGAIITVIGKVIIALLKFQTWIQRVVIHGFAHAWQLAEQAFGGFVVIILTGIRWIIDRFLGLVSVILHGVAAAFGWLPFGIGSSLKKAAKNFDGFRKTVDNSFQGAIDAAKGWGNTVGAVMDTTRGKIDGVAGSIRGLQQAIKNVTVGKGLQIMISGVGASAAGGPIPANIPRLVGEKGPEIFIPRTAGTVIPNHKIAAVREGGYGESRHVKLVVGSEEFDAYMLETHEGMH